jgi:hypothetical protein
MDLLRANGQEIEELNRGQLEEGLTANGTAIRPKYRNPKYARFKQGKNSKPPSGTPDLKLTGKYHKSITAKFQGKKITLEATDSKDKDLSQKYGNEIKGLNSDSLEKLRNLLLNDLRIQFRSVLKRR